MFLQKRLSFVVSFGSSGPQEQRLLGGLCLHTTLTLSRAFSPSLLFFSCRPFFLFASLSECCFRVSDPGLVNKLKGESSIIFCLFNNLNEKRRDQHQTFWLWIYIYIFFFLPAQARSPAPMSLSIVSWPVLFPLSWNKIWKQMLEEHISFGITIMRYFG